MREPEGDTKQRTPESIHRSSKVSKESVNTAQGNGAWRHDFKREWIYMPQSQSTSPSLQICPPAVMCGHLGHHQEEINKEVLPLSEVTNGVCIHQEVQGILQPEL